MNLWKQVAAAVAVVVIAGVNPGCNCPSAPQPIDTQLTNGNPATTGAKVKCNCTVTFSASAMSAMPNLPPSYVEPVEACLTADYANNEDQFCTAVVEPFEEDALLQAGLTTIGGAQLGQRTTTSSQAICGGPYFGTQLNPYVQVSCSHAMYSGPSGQNNVASLPAPLCLTVALDGGADASPDGSECPSIVCKTTLDPTLPESANCLIADYNDVPDACNCTLPNPQACPDGGLADRPLCALPPGSGDPIPLSTSPMTWVASRVKTVTVDPTHSQLDINVDVPLCISTPFGDICGDDVTGSSQPNVSGNLNLYGGPCPGATCTVQIDGLLYVEDFVLNSSDSLGVVSETDTVTGTRIAISVPSAIIAVQPDGSAVISSGQLNYDMVAVHNGQTVEKTGTNDRDATLTINWGANTVTIANLLEPFEQSSGTLNLVGSFHPSLVELLEQNLPTYDTDHDGFPDRIDNCPLVYNPTQVPLPPQFAAVSDVSLTACSAGAAVTITTPPVTDPCDKVVTVTGEAISLDGRPISSIPVVATAPITVEPPFDSSTGLPIAPTPLQNGQITLPEGNVVIQWTAIDTNNAVATVTQNVHSSTVPTLYATDRLSIDDNVVVQTASGRLATIASIGTGTTHIGVSARVGDVFSVGPVFAANNAYVAGVLETGQTLNPQAGATIVGTLTQNDTSIVFAPVPSISPTFPPPTTPQVDLEPNHAESITPGAFGPVSIKENSTLTLASGTYTFASLDLEPQSTVKIDSSQGPVVVYVQQSLIFNGGAIVDVGHPSAPDILLGYVGTQAVNVATPFNGAIFAPNASLTLDTVASPGFTGQFYAEDLEVNPRTTVTHRAYHCGQ